MIYDFLFAVCLTSRITVPAFHPSAAFRIAVADIPFKAPEGWKATKQDGSTTLTPGDVPTGKVYAVVVTPAPGKAPSLDTIYDTGLKMIGEIGTYKPLTAIQKSQSDGGWDFKFTIGTVEKDGSGFLTQVMAVKKGDEGGTVVTLTDSMETMQKYSDDFSNMIRGLGGSPKPPPAPDVAKGSGTVDLQYAVPKGWVESKRPGAIVIEASKDEFYVKYRWTVVVMPSQPLTDSVRETFGAYWTALVSDNYESGIVPMPLMSRLSDGYALAFDGDTMPKHKVSGAKPRTVSVYMLIHGDRFVPILAITYGFEKPLEEDLTQLIETARIPNSSNTKTQLFNKSEIIGDWREGSTSIASYVTSSGGYAGDASIATIEDFHVNADGTFKRSFIGLQGANHIRETSAGTWSIEDNELVLDNGKEKVRYSLFGAGADPKAGRFLILGNAGAKTKLSLSNPRGPFQASWFKAK